MHRVLVVDDEENLRLVLRTLLSKEGYDVQTASSAEEALDRVETFGPDFVLADVRMPGMSGIELCSELKARSLGTTVIVMSAYGSVDLAIEAMKAGAYDYVSKPFKQDEVLIALHKAKERELLRRENIALRQAVRKKHQFDELVAKSDAMQQVFKTITKAAEFKTTVLITGESGTGKELVARALHRHSSRKNSPFVAVNCGAIPETLLESELFGHKRGAFTDASTDKRGLFEEAHGGTLFLDEIGEMPLALQVKLLRALQEHTIRRLGDVEDKRVDVRVVTATTRDLQREVNEKRFREDLFYRLNVLQIAIPPLRDRKEDIMLLLEHFMDKSNMRLGTRIHGLSPRAIKMLMDYPWPGNVRELENTIERACVLAERETLSEHDLPERLNETHSPVSLALSGHELSIKKTVRHIEESLIRRALEKTKGNRTTAARLLEISHRALLYKIKDYGIH
jgi:two-component system response regulator AtoC